ncbi:hypothetical protein GCK72_011934 [Caenorhabditis remanei]|uniref:Uncharacterized protein n=1 Tax=Caenorhabditis remanei TaxID=31234 RepID=A0A6A5H8W4_CAERE|nr:hypothetical protein GCK72_011934 [Caenorhabditis remanei]KAF1763667.1 hypothetical protein GCK72_011934 [Caenorhabditis remanei]
MSCKTATCQKISGDVGDEIVIQPDILVTVNPNPFNIPTVNWDDILKNIPTIPPLVLPTLDPNFLQNLPTIPPLVLPTLDPDFWKNLPTIPPLQLPTLDPKFWQNLNIPTLPPFQIPTLDPNFWQNFNFPTLPPLPTLDPNFWQNLPTIPPFTFQTPTPKTAQCIYKLSQELQSNMTFVGSLNYTYVQSVVDALIMQSVSICNGFQTQRLTDLSKKYGVLVADVQEIVQYFSLSDLEKMLQSILEGDSGQIFQLFFAKTMENLANPSVTAKLSKASTQISTLQFDLLINPI